MAAHGHTRATADFDIWVRPTRANAERVFAALALFGAPLGEVTAESFLDSEMVLQVGVSPWRIDILTSLTGLDFETAWARRKEMQLDELQAPVLSREDLIANKRALGRTKDIADIEALNG